MQYINFIKKVILFFYKHLFKNTKYTFYYFTNYFNNNFKVSPKYYNTENFIKEIIENRKSFIRLGDGEIMLMNSESMWYQKSDDKLKSELFEIIKNYSIENKNLNYILGIPERYVGLSNTELKEKNILHSWLPFKIYFLYFFDKNILYADAHAFYVSGFFEKYMANYFKSKKIIIITTKENIEKQKQKMENNFDIIKWIEAKSPNPYDYFEYYKKEVLSVIENENKNDYLVLAGAGPASKPLAYFLAKENVQTIDVGHGFEHFYSGKSLDDKLI